MSELDLIVSNDRNSKQAISAVLSNIKAVLRNEVQQRQQLQKDLALTNQIIDKHEHVLRESSSGHRVSLAHSHHQDLRMALNEIASVKDQVSAIKLELANYRYKTISEATDGMMTRLSNDIKSLKEHPTEYRKQDLVADSLSLKSQNTLTFRSITNCIHEILQECIRMKSRMNSLEENLSSFSENQYQILRKSVVSDVQQLLGSDQPKSGHAWDSLRSLQKMQQEKIAHLNQSQENIAHHVDKKYHLLQEQTDQWLQESNDRMRRIESILRAEIRSRQSSNNDIQTTLTLINDHVLVRVQGSQKECWEQLSVLATNISKLKSSLRLESDSLNRAHEDLLKSTAGSLALVSKQFQEKHNLQNKTIATLKADMYRELNQNEQHYEKRLESLQKSNLDLEENLSKHLDKLADAMSHDIKSNANQLSDLSLILNQLNKQIEVEINARCDSIAKLSLDVKSKTGEIQKNIVALSEMLENSARRERLELSQLVSDNERSFLEKFRLFELQTESSITQNEEAIRHFAEKQVLQMNGRLSQIEDAAAKQHRDLHYALDVISDQLHTLDQKLETESSRLEKQLAEKLQDIYQEREMSSMKQTSLEDFVHKHLREIQAEMQSYKELSEIQFRSLNQSYSDNMKSQAQVNDHLESVIESHQEKFRQSSAHFDNQIKRILQECDMFFSESIADRHSLRDIIANETAARKSLESQTDYSIDVARKDFFSQLEDIKAGCRNQIQEVEKNLNDRLSQSSESSLSAVSKLSEEFQVLNQTIKKEVDDRLKEQDSVSDRLRIFKEQFDSERSQNQQLFVQAAEKRDSILSDALLISKNNTGELKKELLQQLKDTDQLISSKIEALSLSFENESRNHQKDHKEIKNEVNLMKDLNENRDHKLDEISIGFAKFKDDSFQRQNELEQLIRIFHEQHEIHQKNLKEQQESLSKLVQQQISGQSLDFEKFFSEIRLKVLDHEQKLSSAAEDHGRLQNEILKQNSDVRALFDQEISRRQLDIAAVESEITKAMNDLEQFRQQFIHRCDQLNNDSQIGLSVKDQMENRIDECQKQCSDAILMLDKMTKSVADLEAFYQILQSKVSTVEVEFNNDKENVSSQLKVHDDFHSMALVQLEQMSCIPQIANQLRLFDDKFEQCEKLSSSLRNDLLSIKNDQDKGAQSVQAEILHLSQQCSGFDQIVEQLKQSNVSCINTIEDVKEKIRKEFIDAIARLSQEEQKSKELQSQSTLQFNNLRDEIKMEMLSTTNSLSELRQVTNSYSAELSQLKLDLANLSSFISANKFSELQDGLKNCCDSVEMIRERCDAQFQEGLKNYNNVQEKLREQEQKGQDYRKRDESAIDMKISSVHEEVELELLSISSTVSSLDKQLKSLLATAITNAHLESAIQSSTCAIEGSIDAKLRMQSAARKSLEDLVIATQTSLAEMKSQISDLRSRLSN